MPQQLRRHLGGTHDGDRGVRRAGEVADGRVEGAKQRELTVRRAHEIADGTDHPITGHEQPRPSCVHAHPTANTLTSAAGDQGATRGHVEQLRRV
ncbi:MULTISPECIES: hypothetical protein [unclassified Nocardia]|uniref:hypothetical protein n=1 Tax=unclassified Nocardia TaxID=2637762 RepID=UPI0033AAD9D4